MTLEYKPASNLLTINVAEKSLEFASKFDAFRKLKYLLRTSQINTQEEIEAVEKISLMTEFPLENEKARNQYHEFPIFRFDVILAPDRIKILYADIEEIPPHEMIFKVACEHDCKYGRFHIGEKVSKKILSQEIAEELISLFSKGEHPIIAHKVIHDLKIQIGRSSLPKKYKPEPIKSTKDNSIAIKYKRRTR